LERISSVEVFPPLLAALSFPDEDIRSTAVQVLGRKKNPKVMGNLVQCLGDSHPAVRVHAAEALGHFSDPRLVPHLTALLDDGDVELVKAAIRSLGAIGCKNAEAALIGRLGHESAGVRREATTALGRLEL
jgi:HEAT repeat protein